MTIFIARLQHLGIDVMPIITETGRKRISYHIDGAQPFRGSKLHNVEKAIKEKEEQLSQKIHQPSQQRRRRRR